MSQEVAKASNEKSAPQVYFIFYYFREVGQMKKGDYMIHVYIQEGKQFKGQTGGLVSPMIQITCCGKAKYTQCKSDVGPASTVYWGEHLFFEKQNMVFFLSFNVMIEQERNRNLSDSNKRTYEFDVTFVYFQDKHTLFNSWIALSNPEGKDFNEITCYLKLAISIAGPGDEQVSINDETGPATTDDQEVMMPASIRKEYKQLKIRFVKAEKLPKMDTLGTIDAYIQTMYFKKKLKTKAVTQTKTTQETFIEQEFWIPIQWPLASDRFVLKVFDEDNVKDEIVGSMNFSLKKLIQESGVDGVLKWHNLYGSPLGCSGENTDRMNDFPEVASTWKGRILMHISSFDTKNPEMKLSVLDQEFKTQCMKQGAFELNEYELIAEFGAGICLPGTKKYKLRIQINDFQIDSSAPIEQKGNYNRWSNRTNPTVFKGPYKSIEELGKVFIYLLDGDEPVCFWSGLCSEFLEPNPKPRWIPMQCDLAKGKVKNSWEAGLVQVKLAINHKTKNGPADFGKLEAWKKPPPKRLSSWKIRCFLFQCKDIPSADSDGASDPYITLWNPDNKEIKTQVIEDNINPIFFESLEIYYDYDKIENAPPIVLNIWDKDDLLDADDYLGRCVVYLQDAAICNDDTIPQPKWHDIRLGFSDQEPACGQMLVSFAVVEDDYSFKIPISYLKLTEQIDYKDFDVEINVLGLRNLESFGLMPVKKPFIKFNLRSLLPPEKAQAVTNIKTNPSASGSNPNINTMISFAIDLPVDPLFCPKLQCDVYDYVYKGLVQPLLGTFTLSIGDIMHLLRKEREEELLESQQIIEKLKGRAIQVESEPVFQIEEEEKIDQFEKRMEKLNQLQDQQQDDSTIITSQREKQKLIQGPGSVQITEEDIEVRAQTEEELDKKNLLDKTNADSVQVVPAESPFERQTTKSPFESPAKFKRKPNVTFKKGETQLMGDMKIGVGYKLMIEKHMQKEQEKMKLIQDRQNDLKQMKDQGLEAHKNTLFPSYVYDERLKIKVEKLPKPPATLYYEVGYDQVVPDPEKPETQNKHYRRYYADELENIKEIFPKKPFHTVDIIRGQSRGLSKGFFSFFSKPKTDDSGQVTNQKVVGQFKGRINIQNTKDKEEYKNKKGAQMNLIVNLLEDIHQKKFNASLNFKMTDLESFETAVQFEHKLENMGCDNMGIMSFLKEQSYEEMITRMLLTKTKCICRLYMLEGFDFAQRDIGSFSDPYLKIKCGGKKFNERDNYILDEPNPKFFKMYEFDAEFPGAAPLVIKAYDYDDLFGDDLIGKTVIDLDDRFFCPEWQQIEDKPIEYRQLYHPSSQVSQGVVKMWLEIHQSVTSTKGNARTYDLKPEPILDYELRVVVWDTKDVKNMDVEGTSDVFIKAYLDDKDKKETDCHYRCKNGKASFNYRLLYNLQAPRKNYTLTLQTWDRDLFKSNDFIGEVQLPLQHVFQDAILLQQPINLNKKYFNSYLQKQLATLKKDDLIKEWYDDDSFYLDTKDTEGNSVGLVRISVGVYPGEMSKANPVGGGRSEPNHSPFLPPPVGRIQFTMNPIAMFFELVGDDMRRKIYCYCCLGICCILIIALFPLVTGNLISNGIMKAFS